MTHIDIYIQEKQEEFRQIGEGSVRFMATREECNTFLEATIRQTARETVEDLVPKEKLLSIEQMISKDGKEINDKAYGFNNCRTTLLASAKEKGIL